MLVAVTDHAAERYRQCVRGTLDARTEIAARVGEALEERGAGRFRGSAAHVQLVYDRPVIYAR